MEFVATIEDEGLQQGESKNVTPALSIFEKNVAFAKVEDGLEATRGLMATTEEGPRVALDFPSTMITSENYVSSMDEEHWTEVYSTEFLPSYPYHKPSPRFHRSEFEIVRLIGEGGQGKIYEVKSTKKGADDQRGVLKVFKSSAFGSPQGQWPDEILKIESGYLCNLIGYVDQGDDSIGLLMSRYDKDLRNLIDERMKNHQQGVLKPFDSYQSMNIIVHIALGMKVLHDHGVIHKDLKASNILVRFDGSKEKYKSLVLADFEDSSDVVGTGFWRAPEILQALKDNERQMISAIYTSKSDVYSFGMTCYEILTGLIPLNDHPKSDYDVVLLEKRRPTLPSHVDSKLAKLICQCWHHDPHRRPSSLEIVSQLKHLVEETEFLSRLLGCFLYDEAVGTLRSTSDPLSYLDNLEDMLTSLQRFLTPEGLAVGYKYTSEIRKFVHLYESGFNAENSMEAIILQRTIQGCYHTLHNDVMAPLWWDNVPRPLTTHVVMLFYKLFDWVDYVLRLYLQREVSTP